MRPLISPFARFATVIALTWAMATSGFAHKSGPIAFNDEMRAYLAAGGSLADICGEFGHPVGQTCDACRLVDLASVPDADTKAYRPPSCTSVLDGAVTAGQHRPAVADPAVPTRAPPLV